MTNRHNGERVALAARAVHKEQAWTYDFVYDRTESDHVLKMLVILDEYTRECHRTRVEYGLATEAVIKAAPVLL